MIAPTVLAGFTPWRGAAVPCFSENPVMFSCCAMPFYILHTRDRKKDSYNTNILLIWHVKHKMVSYNMYVSVTGSLDLWNIKLLI